MRRTQWERGRLPTHEYTTVRMALACTVLCRSARDSAAKKRARYSSSDDDDDDSDDDYTRPFQVLDSTIISLSGAIGQHHSAMGVGEVQLGGARLLDVTDINPGQFYELTSFTLDGFLKCVDLHTKLPDQFCSTTTRHKCSKQIGLFICLLRWRNLEWKWVEKIMNLRRNTCSDLYHTVVVEYNQSDYVTLAINVDVDRVMPNLARYMEGTHASGSTHEGMVGVADGKPLPTCRPSYKACKKRGWNYQDDIQRQFYNTHYTTHGLKMAHHVWADGIVQIAVSTIKEADQRLLDASGLDDTLLFIGNTAVQQNGPDTDHGGTTIRPCFYTDPAYTATPRIHRKHKGATTKDQDIDNAMMIRSRSPAEDTFKDFVNLVPYFDDKKKHRLLTNGRACYKQELYMSTIFYNLHTCMYSNQAAGCYYTAPPTPEEYMFNVNLTPCGIAAQADR